MKAAIHALNTDQAASLPPAVVEIGKIYFEGNIVPHQWYQHIILNYGFRKKAA